MQHVTIKPFVHVSPSMQAPQIPNSSECSKGPHT